MKMLILSIVFALLSSTPAWAIECGSNVECGSAWEGEKMIMHQGGNGILKSQVSETSSIQRTTPQVQMPKPTPSVLVRSNGQTMRAGEAYQAPNMDLTEPTAKESKLHGPSMGFKGPRRKIKSYAGSRIQTWSYMPTQVRYE